MGSMQYGCSPPNGVIMNIKKPDMSKPLTMIPMSQVGAKSQQQFKSMPPKDQLKAGDNGVVLHTVGCGGNHLGKC